MNLILLSLMSLANATTCPVGNIKACQEYLKKEYSAAKDERFAEKYNEICNTNPTFSCVKITVRDDVKLVMKEQTEKRGPKAALFLIKIDNEDLIYVLSPKTK